MPYTVEDYKRDSVLDFIDELSADEALRRHFADKLLGRYSADEMLNVLMRRHPPEKQKKIKALIRALQEPEPQHCREISAGGSAPGDQRQGINPQAES